MFKSCYNEVVQIISCHEENAKARTIKDIMCNLIENTQSNNIMKIKKVWGE